MEFLSTLNPTILITAIILNSAGLIYALWILRQQMKESNKMMGNHLQHNTEALTSLNENVKQNTDLTRKACELFYSAIQMVKK